MDNSETYIKMCEKAREIRTIHRWREGDWYVYWMGRNNYSLESNFVPHWSKPLAIGRYKPFNRTGKRRIWLPRQDQLQEMAGYSLKDLLWKFAKYTLPYFYVELAEGTTFTKNCPIGFDISTIMNTFNEYIKPDTSMEQLWLAFVMKEKYNKTWNGEEWIKS